MLNFKSLGRIGALAIVLLYTLQILSVVYFNSDFFFLLVLPIEKEVINKKKRLTLAEKQQIIFPQSVKDMIIGLILSDACLSFPNTKEARLMINQKDQGFVNHIYNELNPLGIVGLLR